MAMNGNNRHLSSVESWHWVKAGGDGVEASSVSPAAECTGTSRLRRLECVRLRLSIIQGGTALIHCAPADDCIGRGALLFYAGLILRGNGYGNHFAQQPDRCENHRQREAGQGEVDRPG